MSVAPGIKKFFTTELLKWNIEENNRQLPWKNEKDPYKIWLSEIILQQTRAEQGRPYYEQFILHYPEVQHLANALEDEVFRLWQGLGYYNRCRNLIAAAKTITQQYNGVFPENYDEILALKGVGPYTAAAITSFAFNLPYAVLDGNVYRVLSRYFGIDIPIDSTEGKKYFQDMASELLDKKQPAAFNQAIMDFGASVCTPQLPDCEHCPLQSKCIAFRQNMISLLPVKTKKLIIKERNFDYLVLTTEHEVYIQQRSQKDIWQGLYEFYLIENEKNYQETSIWQQLKPYIQQNIDIEFENRQKLTHQLIRSKFHLILLKARPSFLTQGIWVEKDSLKNYPFPKTILSFLSRKKYF
ncbi:A/G-specific adenine glycosylase [Taibaiella lutea]|uniref:Adenine DNA glycosylase n=1 Tax=Taibaiella lutea TaxID=2608001 RepID=A0A5M6CPK8_9BACT|nr:A/G-specific adenine glycosylase [Taibaiella lutea]KAA5537181.1 A/G-specific adenine glycosylase [Taibaiella lutea]